MPFAVAMFHSNDIFFRFYSGVAQNFARKFEIPIDHVGFEFNFLASHGEMSSKPPNGAYVRVCYANTFHPSNIRQSVMVLP